MKTKPKTVKPVNGMRLAAAVFLLGVGCFFCTEAEVPGPGTEAPVSPVLTEFSFPTGKGEAPWIEFFNPLDTPVPVSSLRIVLGDRLGYDFPEHLPPVPPKGFIVLYLDGKGRETDRPRYEQGVLHLHSLRAFPPEVMAEPGRIAVYRRNEGRPLSLSGLILWGEPGSDKSVPSEASHIWRTDAFVGQGWGTGDVQESAGKWETDGIFSLGLVPDGDPADPSNWVLYSREERTPGRTNVVQTPYAFSPSSGAVVSSRDVTIGWLPIPGAERYDFQMARDPDFESIFVRTPLDEPSYRFRDPLPEGTYYYRVRAIDRNTGKISAWSEPVNLTTKEMARSTGLLGLFTSVKQEHLLPEMKSICQRKDTKLLCLDGCKPKKGPFTRNCWDSEHPCALFPTDHGFANCARASIAMMVSAYGKGLSQDRIAYYTEEETPNKGDNTPRGDLAHLDPMSFEPATGGEENEALEWALGAPVIFLSDQDPDPSLTQIIEWLDQNRPIMTRIVLFCWPKLKWQTDGQGKKSLTIEKKCFGHVRTMNGYCIDGDNEAWVHILDPYTLFGEGRWQTFDSWNLESKGTWVGPKQAPNARVDEQSIKEDSDLDGVMDFDEQVRFGTDPQSPGSTRTPLSDKDSIRDQYLSNPG